jgi:hypothetical protein
MSPNSKIENLINLLLEQNRKNWRGIFVLFNFLKHNDTKIIISLIQLWFKYKKKTLRV